ncbi:SLIT and NTRK-like protein 6 [Orussus abietinus]|uniref:SLIT and NTRK-like protein 6 n=1 Tax=Orussus abietinus TaxID=222816 RepID=UPI000626DAE6|nr:SLIT and NTRK-like protein 6 [Orussus abietinus]
MKILSLYVSLSYLLGNVATKEVQKRKESSARMFIDTKGNNVHFFCMNSKTLSDVDYAWNNSTKITIVESDIPNITSNTFARFGGTLVILDLHESRIQSIDTLGFSGLHRLQNLVLQGNKLTWIQADWFRSLHNLRLLDLSFNDIQGIELGTFNLLPNLEYVYLDYNQLQYLDPNLFSSLPKLQGVKFGKNPLKWWIRAQISQNLEDRRVNYKDEWEDWTWLNHVARKCFESSKAPSNDEILDCAVEKLLQFTFENFRTSVSGSKLTSDSNQCFTEVSNLLRCPQSSSNVTKKTRARKALQGIASFLKRLEQPQGIFSTSIF